MANYAVVGKSFTRLDGLEKVIGKAIYSPDFKRPGMLYGKILRSDYPHAKVLNIDVSRAKKLVGVKAVITAREVPLGRYGVAIEDQPVLAMTKVRYAGDPVAAVAAIDEEVAEEALKLIRVEYDPLPAVYDPQEALRPGAPLLHEQLMKYKRRSVYVSPIEGSNVCNYFRLRKGDVEHGFKEADHLCEDVFKIPMAHHCYLEPHAAVADVDPSGNVTVWTSTQAPYQLRSDLSEGLQMPLGKIRVIATKLGGGFGGKITAKVEPCCALLSKLTGRPVKIAFSRQDEFACSTGRHPALINIKTGAKRDGRLVAMEIKIIWNTGAYAEHGPIVCRNAGYSAPGPYNVPHVRVDSYCVYTNKMPAGALRGFGRLQTVWARESQLDAIAEQLGLDGLEIRLKNVADEGSISATGQLLHSVGIKACFQKSAGALEWRKIPREKNRGQGLAGGQESTTPYASSACYVKVNEDGSIGVLTSAIDMGQGSDTILAQMAAEELGVSLEDIVMAPADTSVTPFDFGGVSSRLTFYMGNAVKRAAADVKRQLIALAAQMLEARPEDMETGKGKIYVKGSPAKGITLAELSSASHYLRGGPVLGRGSFLTEDITSLDPETGQGAKPTGCWKYAAQAADVKVDTETGQVNILKLAAAADAGFAINPTLVEGQIEGAAVMGIGASLMEESIFNNGQMMNPSFMDYCIPTSLDIPEIVPIIVEEPHQDGPFGAKGVGESCTPPAPAAISNAIYHAVGARMRELPLTPERVLNALKKGQKRPIWRT